jgi:predicted phosphodiesterase
MRTLTVDIPCTSRSDKFIIIPIGDTHKGVVQSNVQKLKELVTWIKSKKNCLVILKGDLLDSIIQADIRFEMKNNDQDYDPNDTIETQVDSLVKILLPIKDRILWIEEGNHEKKVRQRYAVDPTGHLAVKLATKRMGTTNLCRLVFRRKSRKYHATDHVDIYSVHGFGTSTSCLNRLEAMRARIDFDIALAGHVHSKQTKVFPYIYMDNAGHLKQRDIWCALTGSFYDTYKEGADSYGEDAGYKPEKTGVARIDLEPFRHTKEKIAGKWSDLNLPCKIHISL